LVFCFFVVGCGDSQESNSESLAPTETAETTYTRHLLKEYYIGDGCSKQTYTEGTIRDNKGSGVSNAWLVDSDSEYSMDFDVLQIVDLTLWSSGIDRLVFSRLREIGPDPETDPGVRNVNTLSMLVFLEQTIGEEDAGSVVFKSSNLAHDLSSYSKSKSKIRNLHRLIRSNADVACDVIGRMRWDSNLSSLEEAEQKKLDKVEKDLREIIGFNGKSEITDIEKWLSSTRMEYWLGEQKQKQAGEKNARKQQEDEEAWQEYLESEIPKCVEYPSDNPKYSIVKCTNLP
jgi:hypothetical protein